MRTGSSSIMASERCTFPSPAFTSCARWFALMSSSALPSAACIQSGPRAAHTPFPRGVPKSRQPRSERAKHTSAGSALRGRSAPLPGWHWRTGASISERHRKPLGIPHTFYSRPARGRQPHGSAAGKHNPASARPRGAPFPTRSLPPAGGPKAAAKGPASVSGARAPVAPSDFGARAPGQPAA